MPDNPAKAERSVAGTAAGLPSFIPRTPLGWIAWGFICFTIALILVGTTFVIVAKRSKYSGPAAVIEHASVWDGGPPHNRRQESKPGTEAVP